MRKFIKVLQLGAIVLLLVLSTNSLFAQPLPPNPSAPIGGGLGFLAIAGAIFGYRKLRANKK